MMRFISIFLMEVLAGAEVDLFIPSFPDLQRHFGLSPFMVELTLGVNFVAYCITSLIVGQLSDRYGRKPMIMWSLLLFIIGSLMCVYADSYWHLLMGRFLQGVGIAAPAVLSYVVIADAYPLDQQQKLLGILNGAITLGMAFAPVVGSYVNLHFGWVGNFEVLLVMGVICFIMGQIWVPSHSPTSKDNITPFSLKGYLPLFQSWESITFISVITLFITPYWVFIGIAPILYMDGMGVSLTDFGYYQGALALSFAVISLSSAYFLKIFGTKACFYVSLIICLISLVLTTLVAILQFNYPLLITGILVIWSMGVVLPINILYPMSLEVIEGAKGRIAATIQSSRLLLTAMGLQFVGYLYVGSFKPLGLTMVITFGLSLYGLYILLTKYKIAIGSEKKVLT
jgi:DHA1 family bicyclomycin/chloramphenicol resistance-like MFS transporter